MMLIKLVGWGKRIEKGKLPGHRHLRKGEKWTKAVDYRLIKVRFLILFWSSSTEQMRANHQSNLWHAISVISRGLFDVHSRTVSDNQGHPDRCWWMLRVGVRDLPSYEHAIIISALLLIRLIGEKVYSDRLSGRKKSHWAFSTCIVPSVHMETNQSA